MAIFISYLIARAILGTMLVASGAAKLANSTDFANTLKSLGIMAYREKIPLRVAIAFSCIELLVGGCTITGFWTTAMNIILLIVMVFFSLVVLFALYKAPQTKCRCFGTLSNSRFDQRMLIRNIIFSAIALFVSVSSFYFHPLQGEWLMSIPLIIGNVLFAFGVVQATRTEYLMKESTKS